MPTVAGGQFGGLTNEAGMPFVFCEIRSAGPRPSPDLCAQLQTNKNQHLPRRQRREAGGLPYPEGGAPGFGRGALRAPAQQTNETVVMRNKSKNEEQSQQVF